MKQSTGDSGDNPLGRPAITPLHYAPEVLFAIPRSESRSQIGIDDSLPFTGIDTWNAWELTWLDPSGKPRVAVAELNIDAASPKLVESKSLKLYLGAFAMECFAAGEDLVAVIESDLSALLDSTVGVRLYDADRETLISPAAGCCIDEANFAKPGREIDANLLRTLDESIEDATLHSHLFRSLCPVTGQPDYATVIIRYSGRAIDPGSLLAYLVSYRMHQDFHEACVERMFVDLKLRCGPPRLAIHARYTRRGGIDINPYRTDTDWRADNARLNRQ